MQNPEIQLKYELNMFFAGFPQKTLKNWTYNHKGHK